jgi:hypothetical protein
MRAWGIALLILLACATECFAYGSIASGYSALQFVPARDLPTLKDPWADDTVCTQSISMCDKTLAPELIREDAVDEQPFSYFADPKFWRVFQVRLVGEFAAKIIVLALLLWIIGSAVSRSSSTPLKRRAVTFAWIALPSAPLLASSALDPIGRVPGDFIGQTLFLWTIVFAALAIGASLRRFLTGATKHLDILSLPLAVLVFSIVVGCSTALFFTYGLFPLSALKACENEEMVLLSYCGLVRLDGFYLPFFGILILIAGGIVLPSESPLIRACTTYRHAAKLRLIIGLGVTAVVISALVEPLLDLIDWWRNQKILGFAIAGISFILFFSAVLLIFIFLRMQRLEQLPNANARPLDWPLSNPQRMPANDVNQAQPQPRSDQPGKRSVNNELDVQALKDAIKNRRRHFEPLTRTSQTSADTFSSPKGTGQ